MFSKIMLMGPIGDAINNFFYNIGYWFHSLLYGIFKAIAQVCNWIELIFKAFCGLVNVSGNAGDLTYDPASIVMTNSTVQTIFFSLFILGVVVLFITTFVANIKTEFNGFSDKESNSKKKILGYAGRAIVNMVTIPVCCILGVMMANVLLRALYSALNRGSNATIATQVFVAIAYDANRARNDEAFVEAYNLGYNNFGVLNDNNYPGYDYADMIDAAFLNDISFEKINGEYNVTHSNPTSNVTGSGNVYYPIDTWTHNAKGLRKQLNRTTNLSYEGNTLKSFSIYNSEFVALYYDFDKMGFLLGIIAIVLVTWNMCMMIMGLIKRIFDIGMYYLISPPIIALYPIDGGNGCKAWRGKFIGATVSAYGGVIAMNTFLILLPIVLQIDFVSVLNFPSFLAGVIGYFIKVLIIIAGTNFLKAASADIQLMLAGKDNGTGALNEGFNASHAVGGTLAKTAKLTGAAAGLGLAAAGTMGKIGLGVGAGLVNGLAGGVGGIAQGSGAGGKTSGFFSGFGSGFKQGAGRFINGQSMMNSADRLVGRTAGLFSQIKQAAGGKAPDSKKPRSKTMARDAVNFFRTGTTDKERQQAIMKMKNEANESRNMFGFTKDFEQNSAKIEELEAKKASGTLKPKQVEKIDKQLADLKKKQDAHWGSLTDEQKKFMTYNANGTVKFDSEGKYYDDEIQRIQAGKSYKKLTEDQKKAIEQLRAEKEQHKRNVDKMNNSVAQTGFFSLRSMDRATGSGRNTENIDPNSNLHQVEQDIHKRQVGLRMHGV